MTINILDKTLPSTLQHSDVALFSILQAYGIRANYVQKGSVCGFTFPHTDAAYQFVMFCENNDFEVFLSGSFVDVTNIESECDVMRLALVAKLLDVTVINW